MAVLMPLPSADVVALRRYRVEDTGATYAIFKEAVRRGASEHYSEPERLAWAPALTDLYRWGARLLADHTWLAEDRGSAAGFVSLRVDAFRAIGLIDLLYVHPDQTRRGLGSALLEEAERCARELGLVRVEADASLTAKPMFERQGFEIIRRQSVPMGDERLVNFVMHKQLEP